MEEEGIGKRVKGKGYIGGRSKKDELRQGAKLKEREG